MNGLEQLPQVTSYLDRVCSQVRAKPLHRELRTELSDHLNETVRELEAAGWNREEGVRQALFQLGDADRIGREFNQAHRPRPDYGLWGALALLAAFGSLMSFAYFTAVDKRFHNDLGPRQTLFALAGFLLLLPLSRLPYRILARASAPLYAAAVALIFYAQLSWPNGRLIIEWGSILFDVSHLIGSLFLASFAACVFSKPWRKPGWRGILAVFLFVLLFWLVPGIVYARANDFSELLLYGLTAAVILAAAVGKRGHDLRRGGRGSLQNADGRKRRSWAAVRTAAMAGIACLSLTPFVALFRYAPFRPLQERFWGGGNSYQLVQAGKAMQEGGLTGHGFGATLKTLPVLYSDMAFPYLVYSLGWGAAILFIAVLLYVGLRMVRTVLALRDPFGRCLAAGVVASFGIQAVWNIAMCFGLLPIIGVGVPFLSYGPMLLLQQFISFGVLLSVFRRRDQIPSLSAEAAA